MPICPDGHNSSDPDFCDVCGMRIGGAAAPPAEPDPGSGVSAPAPATASASAGPDAAAESCPQCGTVRSGQFCETCGYDFASGKPTGSLAASSSTGPAAAAGTGLGGPDLAAGAAPTTGPASALDGDGGSGDVGTGAVTGGPPGSRAPVWTAVVSADRAYYDSVITEGGPDAASIEFPGYCPERRFRLSGQEMRIGRRSVSRGLEPEIDLTGPPTDPGVSHLHAVLMAEPDSSWVVLDPGSANGTMVNGGEIPGGVRVPLHDGDRICVGAWTVLTIRTATS
jgi:FHA domain